MSNIFRIIRGVLNYDYFIHFFCWGVGLKKKKDFLIIILLLLTRITRKSKKQKLKLSRNALKKKKKEKKRRKEWEGELIGSVRVEMRGEARRLIVD